MLNIYTGRENLDKDKFIFDQISTRLTKNERVILIVPDQYTLQAEKNAFAYLQVDGLMDLEILSFSRLANRVFSEVGGGRNTFVNNYGKYMMISRILLSGNTGFKVFKNLEGSTEFVEKVNNFISEIKNYNLTPELLKHIVDAEDGDTLLSRKLEDISHIYEEYEKMMGEDRIDTADYLGMFVSKIGESNLIRKCTFWISDFDYLSPRHMDAVMELTRTSKNVSIVLTAEEENVFFKATNSLANELRHKSLDHGWDAKIIPINDEYVRSSEGREPMAHLEEQFCSSSPRGFEGRNDGRIELISAANYYSEAETAAVKISELIRDGGMRYRDILVICNDMDVRASVIKRVFSEYGLPVFMDQRRGIHHNPVLEYITALLDIEAEGLLPDLIFKLLKTGLTPLNTDTIEELENYVIKFKIIGSKWKREFTLTLDGYTEEELEILNMARLQTVTLIERFKARLENAVTAKERVAGLFNFLTEESDLLERITEYVKTLETAGKLGYAEEMSQVWKVIVDIFDQLISVLGDEELSDDEFATVLKTGFESIQMGMLPPSADQILLGTMQRTRSGNVKATFVLGANDGILPAYTGEETLLNEDERDLLLRKGDIICRSDEQIMQEEQMAIYRNLSKPEDYLSISYSVSDTEGSELNPSIVFEKVKRLLPNVPVMKDILNRDLDTMTLIQGQDSTANHLTDAMRSWITGEVLPELWAGVYKWFDQNRPDMTRQIERGLTFRNNRDVIDEKFVVELYRHTDSSDSNKIESSPSGLESFSRCPFSFFMGRGIRLRERRVFELDGRDVGDLYHRVLMEFGESMCADGKKPLAPDSRWNVMTDDECTDMLHEIYDRVEDDYREGLFDESSYETYRGSRFKDVVTDTALEIKSQVNKGRIEKMFFESRFSKGAEFEPIIINRKGKTVEVNGQIDRLDMLEGGYAKIIDYKSGYEELVREDVLNGWQLQLMVYMKAITDSDKSVKPGGVFYFRIPEPHVKTDGMNEVQIKDAVKKEMAKQYRMNGLVINDKAVVESITGELSNTYNIIDAKSNGNDSDITGKAVTSNEDFAAMQDTVSDLIEELCDRMLAGDVKAKPKESRAKGQVACTWCPYRGICGYDKSFGG